MASLKRKAFLSRGGLIVSFAVACAVLSWGTAPTPTQSSLILAHLNAGHQLVPADRNARHYRGPAERHFVSGECAKLCGPGIATGISGGDGGSRAVGTKEKYAAEAANPQAASQPVDQQQSIAKATTDTDSRIADLQSQIADMNAQIAKASSKSRQALISQRDALQGELDLYKTIQDSLQKIASVANSEVTGSGLSVQIAQLKQSVPEVFALRIKKRRRLEDKVPRPAPPTTRDFSARSPSCSARCATCTTSTV